MKYICRPQHAFELMNSPQMEVDAEKVGDEYRVVYGDKTRETVESAQFERTYRLKPPPRKPTPPGKPAAA